MASYVSNGCLATVTASPVLIPAIAVINLNLFCSTALCNRQLPVILSSASCSNVCSLNKYGHDYVLQNLYLPGVQQLQQQCFDTLIDGLAERSQIVTADAFDSESTSAQLEAAPEKNAW